MSETKEPKEILSLEKGVSVIRAYLKNLPNKPGVYRMINDAHKPVYVGKAKSLKKRVSSYTNANKLPMRLKRMIAETTSMEFITTHTEVEALLLEANMIRKHKPQYNVLLKDGKSFPYILITEQNDYPQILKHRGAQKVKGKYYGPFASAGAVNEMVTTIQRAFMLRNCTDSYFEARKRPCLQYDIKRCTAPCVGYVTEQQYKTQVSDTKDFLEGKSEAIRKKFTMMMNQASMDMAYELAASYRDRIRALSYIKSKQGINIEGIIDADIICASRSAGYSCIQVFFFRGGQNLGNKPYFFKHAEDDDFDEVFESFIQQFYQARPMPKEIYLNYEWQGKDLLREALSQQKEDAVKFIHPQRGHKRSIVDWVARNAREALERHIAEQLSTKDLLKAVQDIFNLEKVPERIEVYDNSHTSGTNMVGAMIVADQDGFKNSAYRKFNIKMSKASDDFGMMREVMLRRFSKAKVQDKGNMPDLLLIDGGKGQLSAVKETLKQLKLWNIVKVVAISKGPDRNAGKEDFHIDGQPNFKLEKNDPVLFYLQRLRDEAHRFAISAHRTRRKKDMEKSPLDRLEGIGPKRKKALIQYFGSAKAVTSAGISELSQVEGISNAMAEKIYNYFHEMA